jgi:hypothetical protein
MGFMLNSKTVILLATFLIACSQSPVSTLKDDRITLKRDPPDNTKFSGYGYSPPALHYFCTFAQKIIAKTTLRATNRIWEDLEGFIGSNALPYDGAENEPLTTQQYVESNLYPQTVMCKMKSWDALAFYYPGSASPGASCSGINRDTHKRVLKSLRKQSVAIKKIIFDEWITYTGEQWTHQSPATTIYTSTVDHQIHVVGKSLYVERTNWIPFIGPEKKGIHYCQIVTPNFLRQVITGQIKAPTCDPPPRYSTSPFKPLPIWPCQDPGSPSKFL